MWGIKTIQALSAIVAVAVAGQVRVHGDEPTGKRLHHIDLYVSPTLATELAEYLCLSIDQAAVFESIHVHYWRRLQEIDAACDERVRKENCGFSVELEFQLAAQQSKDNEDWAKASDIARKRHELRIPFLLDSDALLGAFLTDVKSILEPAQSERAATLRRHINIRRWFETLSQGRLGDYTGVVDLRALVETASDNGPLYQLNNDTDTSHDARRIIDGAIEQWETYLDQTITNAHKRSRSHLPRDYSIRVQLDDKERARRLRVWNDRVSVLRASAAQVGSAAELLGGLEARLEWEDRFGAAFCPSLFREQLPDILFPTICDSLNDDPRIETITLQYAQYGQRRRHARWQAVESALNVKRKGQWEQLFETDEQLDYAKTLLAIRKLTFECLWGWRATVDPAMAARIDSAILGRQRDYPELLGPILTKDTLDRLGEQDPYRLFTKESGQ